jgi:hypothetical protein
VGAAQIDVTVGSISYESGGPFIHVAGGAHLRATPKSVVETAGDDARQAVGALRIERAGGRYLVDVEGDLREAAGGSYSLHAGGSFIAPIEPGRSPIGAPRSPIGEPSHRSKRGGLRWRLVSVRCNRRGLPSEHGGETSIGAAAAPRAAELPFEENGEPVDVNPCARCGRGGGPVSR